jgi:hypothetical protein
MNLAQPADLGKDEVSKGGLIFEPRKTPATQAQLT